MNRRDAARVLIAFGAAFGTRGAGAQQRSGTRRKIGFLSALRSEFNKPFQQLLRDEFLLVGYEEGRNLLIERRYAEGNMDRLHELAEDLVRNEVEVIIVQGNEACLAAMRATNSLPIVLLAAVVPVEAGLVRSLSHPGGNVTGTTFNSPEMAGKVLEVLKDAVPRVRRVAVLWNPEDNGVRYYGAQADHAAKALGVTLQYFDVTRREEIGGALKRIAASRPDAMCVVSAPVIMSGLSEIISFAIENKLPSIGVTGPFVAAGGLLFYGPNGAKITRRTVSYVDQILRGAKPADLPVEQPTDFELVVNLKTARAIGLKIPQSVLVRANRVIE